MRITPIQNYSQNRRYDCSFQAYQRGIYDKTGKFLYNTTTYFFRPDLDWDALGNFISYVYRKVDKVNVFCHACSTGMEPYSFVIQTLKYHLKEAKKFLPVIAKDLTQENIEIAKKGYLGINIDDLWRIKTKTRGDYSTYLNFEKTQDFTHELAVQVTDLLKDNVKFAQGDIFEDIGKMPRSNTVLFCRNFWPYLSPEKREKLATMLENKFDDTSLVIIGDYDTEKANVDKLLRNHGFYEFVGISKVFCKFR